MSLSHRFAFRSADLGAQMLVVSAFCDAPASQGDVAALNHPFEGTAARKTRIIWTL
jgi:hypothetical protein